MMEQIPSPRVLTWAPATVQMEWVLEVKVMGRPEVDVAMRGTVAPTVTVLGGALKVMVCWESETVKVWVRGGAAAYAEFPACVAVMEHVPTVIVVTWLPETVQIEEVFEVKVTGSPELAEAPSVYVTPTPCGAIALKVIVCELRLEVTGKLCVTGAAAV